MHDDASGRHPAPARSCAGGESGMVRRDTRRVVITGMGAVSSIGIGKDDFWRGLVEGRSGISDVERFDASAFGIRRAGEVKNFRPESFMKPSEAKRIGRGAQLAIAAARLALEDGAVADALLGTDRTGVIMGTTMGEAPSIEMIDRFWVSAGEDGVYPSHVRNFPVVNLAGAIARVLGIKGCVYVIPTACAAGNYSIGYAFDLIRTGRADLIIAGGADPLSRLAFTGFQRLFAMAPERCQPFDKNRKGMMVGEGGAALIVESLEHALERKAPIYAEIRGYGLSCDAFNMTIQAETGIAKVMEHALRNSGVAKEAVDFISAHGTGTANNDKTESAAIRAVFGALADHIPVNSIKSMLGHTMGTASALEAIMCCMVIGSGMIPPTINYETPDPDCAVDCVPNTPRRKRVKVALNNSFAFGGNNACLALADYE